MINSKDPKELEAHVYANVMVGMAMCEAIGYPISFDNTLRDQEYQTYLNKQGKAPALVSFHGYGLAFDIRWKGSATPYADEFYAVVAPIFKAIGFSWMHDIAGYDKCHFQWDNYRAISSSMVRAGHMPPAMPLYQEGFDMYIEKIAQKAGVSVDATVDALAAYVANANIAEDKWEDKAVQDLRAAGVITSDHPGNAPVFWGEFASTVLKLKKG